MSTAGALGSASVAQQDIAYPYPPSWFDRLKVWVERLPGPPWLFYLLVGAVLFALLTLTQWQAGAYPIGTINAFHLWFAMEIGYLPAVLHYLDRAALNALAASRPTLNIDGSQYEVLRYQLTTLPARQTNWVSLVLALNVSIVTVIFVPTSPDAIQALQTSAEPVSLALFAFLFGLTWWCLGVLVVHTIHQLRLVGRIYKEYVTINLFDLGPLYAFSGITA
ncbi:MAG: hypothetical protein IT330_15190, partial [Anaerolineae bacterium]|nr:hypothetical protein [Anaerolineae bacterium]